jgi:hypothetical protein
MNLGGLLAGLSGLPQGFIQGQQAVDQHQRAQQLMQMQQAQFQQQQLQRQQQAQAAAGFLGLLKNMPQQQQAGFGDQVPTTLPGGTGVGIQPGGVPGGAPPGLAPGFSRDASGGMTQNGQSPSAMLPGGIPAWEIPTMRGIVQQDESGGRNIPNQQGPGGSPASTASGYSQITDPTWRDNAPAVGAGQYPRAMSAPASAQNAVTDQLLATRGLQPWQSNKKLMADATAALTQAGIPTSDVQPALEGAAQAKASIPQAVAGKVPVQNMAQLIEKVMPGASDEAKVGALMMLHNYLAPEAKQQMAVMMAEFKGQMQQQLRDTETPFQKQELGLREREAADREANAQNKPGQIVQQGGKTYRIGPPGTAPEEIKFPGEGPVTKIGASQQGAGAFPPDVIELLSDQGVAGDNSWKTNLGRGQQGAANIAAVDKRIAEKLQAQGLTGKDLAIRQAEFGGLKAGERTLTNRTAQIGMRINEAQRFAPLALAASEKVDRTQFPAFNRLYEAGLTGTGDENVVRLAVATNSFLNAYAAAVTPTGTPTEGAQTRARAILDSAWSKGQFRTGIDQLMLEMSAAQQSPGTVREEFRRGTDPGQSANPAVPPGSPSAGSTPSGGQAPTITSKEQYDALQPGAPFIWNGKQGTKP